MHLITVLVTIRSHGYELVECLQIRLIGQQKLARVLCDDIDMLVMCYSYAYNWNIPLEAVMK